MITLILAATVVALQILLVVLVTRRHDRDLADAEARADDHSITLQQRADAVAIAHQASLDNLKRLRLVRDEDRKRLWLSVRDACDAEIQDVHAALQAGVA
ncbi:hypothetical protein MMG85_11950 [Pseudoxanthomonas sp. LH2527]|uniref:hypothetical protein n=1 Tax=Pseudoxanthomonas sp. LH2527 TaxID=2923249 RepID=UPI001F1320E6|nr:hypothetical protein [Pseudoxanthomonas sp. LH2527]MCH6484271.1 hypothetical protein [Pseudoxanthomonas sp. LH2527]